MRPPNTRPAGDREDPSASATTPATGVEPSGLGGRGSRGSRGSRWRVAALVLLSALLACDLGLSVVLADGFFGARARPPFGPVTSARQRDWLAQQRTELAGEALAAAGQAPPAIEQQRFDSELGWTRVHPGALERSEGGRLVENGNLHTRPPRLYGARPAPGATRIACFGDSYTFGAEVGDRECWTHYLQGDWQAAEVLNFGVGGFGTDQAFLRYRREGSDIGARAVLLGVLLENIGRNVNRYRPLWYPASGTCVTKPRFALDARGELELLPNPFPTRAGLIDAVESGAVLERVAPGDYWSARPRLGPLRYSGFARMLGGYLAYTERDVAGLWRRTDEEPFQVTLAILEQFHREALADGAEFAGVLIFPRQGDLEHLAEGDRFWRAGLERLDRAGIPWLDLSDPLLEAWRASPGAVGPAGLDWLYGGGHLSAEGNRVAADAIGAWLSAHTGWQLD